MKKILGLLGIAILGGVITLGGYKMFFNESSVFQSSGSENSKTIRTNFVTTSNETSANFDYESVDFTLAAEKSLDAVVHVKNTTTRTQYNPLAEFFYGNGSGTRKFEQVGTGSGVIISSDGYIVTNNHVVDGANDIEIILNDKKVYKAKLIGADKNDDIALLKISADNELPFITFANSDNVKVGEWVLAVGNPYNLTSTVTAGIVSAKGRDLDGNGSIDSFIQTDAAVNPGNSGGALVNTRGELIGINTAISSATGSFIGYSFAIPSNITKKIVDDLLEFGNVQEAVLGIVFNTQENNDVLGVKISDVEQGQGAAKAGLKKDDIIVKVNNVKITKFADLKGQLTAKRPGEFVEITIDRNGELITKNVQLSKKPKQLKSPSFNWELKDVSKQELKDKGIKNGVKIVELINRGENSLNNYIITKINDKPVSDAEEGVKMLESIANSKSYIIIEMINLKGEKETLRFR
ncbi:MAG: PDZ domain-containing protein [Flavobacteriia bacterium]|nr:PDZ domain-containing protein [Flavobacteriia bacterium]OIP47306.1 MAG: serine protease [Flavobacteriaceae bacterium CG2_30_31_66]PIV96113.1 MAG: serine protease [Flavobacteriaceae bacterium CG17_big_fil_post_rev_8_21_14_2_50_31_13]PIX12610.1 MAG: serine protease [Flavobacteriaceae bacterium CG_4_8_14_3_um_filter_31_8]PIY14330.1 MAG: serine protease [Flavobacteriaceae bacterium CG_4_10_14_3_um_filter_31_253]PIZ10417.1 MAG: serine protease [Flavobacteriaceae bacterium CG_4_10_14_0_8_um_filte